MTTPEIKRANESTSTARLVCCLLALFVLIAAAHRSHAAQGDCGQPISVGDTPTATDSLFALRTAVELASCSLCVCDWDDSGAVAATDALIILQVATGDPQMPTCPACNPAGECPSVAQFTLLAGTRGLCNVNADCGGLGICNPGIGRCVTPSRFDGGWTGLAHGADVNDFVPSRLLLACDADAAPCGECQFVGLDPFFRNCRCANDNRTVCAQPFQADDDSCGGEICQCYFGPPTPLSSGNTPTCSVSEITAVSGGANADLGAGTISLNLRTDVALGPLILSPCPYCDGDTMPGDGVNDGTCVGGGSDGQSCDAQSANSTFPAPGGGRSSLDCLPDENTLISGPGIRTRLDIATEVTQLPFNLDCSQNPLFPGDCPCRVCSGDPTLACSSDSFCDQLDAGACDSNGVGIVPRPNQCADGQCTEVAVGPGGNFGICAAGPVTRYCDGIVRADTSGLISCLQNVDCSESSVGVDAGNCTIEEPRPCFPDPIIAAGSPSPIAPLGAAAFCGPPTSSLSVNSVAGLPGPSRVVYQTVLGLFCSVDDNPLAPPTYTPGVGGCP